ncbi:hypothetical protein WJ970_01035 [Achromobacter xylosoxidans]
MSPPRDAVGGLSAVAPVRPPVGVRAIVCLGLSQLIGWGVTFYLIGALGPAITAGLGWNSAAVYGGFYRHRDHGAGFAHRRRGGGSMGPAA